MFKKLKNRFLLLNLITITIMMLVAFAAIYAITYQNVRRDIDVELHNITEFYRNAPGDGRQRGGQDAGIKPGGSPFNSDFGEPPLGKTVSFMLLADANNALIDMESRFDLEQALYVEALGKALETGDETGQFTIDGNDWAFHAQPIAIGTLFVFMDVTAQQGILTNLIYTFLAVGLGMLIVIYWISRMFASRSIKPVKEAFEKQKQFIADASHELKTPLAVIQTNTDVLLANRDDTIASQEKWLNYIKQETQRMAKLTGDLLYLTEMEDARIATLHTEYNLSDALETIMLTMEAVIFEKQLRFDYEIEPGLMTKGSAEQMMQVIMILLDNAIKYANPQGAITLTLKKKQNDAVLSVTNTGEGISPEHLDRIFDRFYRTDTSRSRAQGGHGLGLAIAKSIVEQHGGKLSVRSVVGESTTFVLHLPAL
ncbi:HAMP domain-containing sensor histidine kinase [Paenibacillus sp. HB172176]|uniref:sensor histidine kinase n=1 Tax=Paenibacillus sp. HB172176 TaxID=2493690 RepID=UPI00143B2262|nr:HAMP domain-containing sensor histidine kinase [Paenibacillus sp. HB172176]